MALLAICCSLALSGVGQNLVPNGSFEQLDTCPDFSGYAQFASGWENLYTQSADYFNSCNSNGVVGIPSNQFGYQFAAEGDAYVGMATSAPGGGQWYRELVGIELQSPLIPGVPVCLSFQTAMGGFGNWAGNSTPYSCKGIGLKFFTVYPEWGSYLYPNDAAVNLDMVPTDTSIWYSASGVYYPDSAYTHVVIGNFFADSLNDLTLIDSTGFGALPGAYAFVDDVRVSFDLSFCTTSLEETDTEDGITLFPNPALDQVVVGQRSGAEVTVVDAMGRLLWQGRIIGDRWVLEVGSWARGSYLLRMAHQGKLETYKFILTE